MAVGRLDRRGGGANWNHQQDEVGLIQNSGVGAGGNRLHRGDVGKLAAAPLGKQPHRGLVPDQHRDVIAGVMKRCG